MSENDFLANGNDSFEEGHDEFFIDNSENLGEWKAEHEPSNRRVTPDDIAKALERCGKFLSTVPRRRAGEEMLQSLRTLQRVTLTRVRDTLTREINNQLGKLMGIYNGLECSLYFLEEDESGDRVLRPRFSVGCTRGSLTVLPVNGDSLEGCSVFKPDKPEPNLRLVADDVFIAVPIIGGAIPLTGGEEVLGVLSMRLHFSPGMPKFCNGDVKLLQVDAKMLAVNMLCYRYADVRSSAPCLWSPASHGWRFDDFLTDICQTVVQSQQSIDNSAAYSSSIWNVDEDQSKLWVQATYGYDYEFLSTGLGKWNSYTTHVSTFLEGETYIGPPLPEFVGKEKGKAAGLTSVFSVPLFLTPSDAEIDLTKLNVFETSSEVDQPTDVDRLFELRGKYNSRSYAPFVFHIYRFAGWGAEDDLSAFPEDSHGTEVSVIIEEWLMAYEYARNQAALAFLEAKMEAARKEWMGWQGNCHKPQNVTFHALKEVLSTCLDADGCSIFEFQHVNEDKPDGRSRRLVLVSTTGLTSESEDSVQFGGDRQAPPCVFYDLDNPNDQGLMCYLQKHPECGVLRLHSIDDQSPDWQSEKTNRGFRVVRRHMEDLSPDTEDRRFMGVSITTSEGVQIVVRLVRPSNRPPFTKQDEELLKSLMQLCMAMNLWQGPDEVLTKAMEIRRQQTPHNGAQTPDCAFSEEDNAAVNNVVQATDRIANR